MAMTALKKQTQIKGHDRDKFNRKSYRLIATILSKTIITDNYMMFTIHTHTNAVL